MSYACTCPSEYDHTCPFREEIYGDSEFECACCENCTDNCALDI